MSKIAKRNQKHFLNGKAEVLFCLGREDNVMMECQIKLTETEDVREFVAAATKCDFDIDIFYNRVTIDAKSILGILSMDLTRVLTVKCYGEDEKFLNSTRNFAVA